MSFQVLVFACFYFEVMLCNEEETSGNCTTSNVKELDESMQNQHYFSKAMDSNFFGLRHFGEVYIAEAAFPSQIKQGHRIHNIFVSNIIPFPNEQDPKFESDKF